MSTPRVPASPGITRLDRVLDLVTEHESHIRSQELKIEEMARRMADNEDFLARELGPLRDVDVRAELEAAKGAVDRLHQQVVMLSQDQGLRQEAMSKVTTMQHELEEFKRTQTDAMAEVRKTYKSFLQEVLDKMGKQFESHRKAVRSDVQKLGEEQAEHRALTISAQTSISSLKAMVEQHGRLFEEREEEMSRAATSQERKLGEVLGRMEAISSDRDKLRKRISKLQSVEPGPTAEVAEALEKHRREISELRGQCHSLRSHHDRDVAEKSSLAAKLADAQMQVQQLEEAVEDRSRDLSAFAENVSEVLHRRVRGARAAQDSAVGVGVGFGYGGGLAGGYAGSGRVYAPTFAVVGGGAGLGSAEPDDLHRFDTFLEKLNKRLRSSRAALGHVSRRDPLGGLGRAAGAASLRRELATSDSD